MHYGINIAYACLPFRRFRIGCPPSRCLGLMVFLALTVNCTRTGATSKTEVLNNIVYGSGYVAAELGSEPRLEPLLMDIIQPGDQDLPPRPAAILIHGGSFEHGSKANAKQREVAFYLAEQGYVCFLINYRLVKDAPPAPEPYSDVLSRAIHAAVVDAKSALRHITANAGRYQIDPLRVALAGFSAGAITALAAGLSPPHVFANDGPDYPVPAENFPDVEIHVAAIVNLWGSADFFPEYFNRASPPVMTVHGGKDFRVGVSLLPALNIDSQCKKHGIPHVFYPFPDAGHGVWDAMVDGKPLATLIAEFLDGYVRAPDVNADTASDTITAPATPAPVPVDDPTEAPSSGS